MEGCHRSEDGPTREKGNGQASLCLNDLPSSLRKAVLCFPTVYYHILLPAAVSVLLLAVSGAQTTYYDVLQDGRKPGAETYGK